MTQSTRPNQSQSVQTKEGLLTTSHHLEGLLREDADQAGRHAVSFVLPAHNEEENITRAIESTVAVALRTCSAFEVIVVDDGSSDRTAELVEVCATRHPQVRLVQHSRNKGYGEALRSGFSHATQEFVFYTDADNQFEMQELPLLLAWADQADVVAGYRRVRRDPVFRRANAWCWNRLVRALFFVPVRDIDCAFKLYRRESLAAIEVESRGAMIDTEIMVKLARRGSTIVEVGVTHLPRTAGSTSGANAGVILRALREVWRMYPELSRLDTGQPSPVSRSESPRIADINQNRREATV
jgi:glycosyltransferase involved in cell wall biosynthesis